MAEQVIMSSILGGVHFSALEYSKMKCKGRMAHTTAKTTMSMNTEGTLQRHLAPYL